MNLRPVQIMEISLYHIRKRGASVAATCGEGAILSLSEITTIGISFSHFPYLFTFFLSTRYF